MKHGLVQLRHSHAHPVLTDLADLRWEIGCSLDQLGRKAWAPSTASQDSYRDSHWFPWDLVNKKRHMPWRALWSGFPYDSLPGVLQWVLFLFFSAWAHFAEPVSSSLFIFIFPNTLCHYFLLFLINYLFKRRTRNPTAEGKISNPKPGSNYLGSHFEKSTQ